MNTRFRDFIEEVRAASNLVEVIGADVALQPSGSVLKGLSPFHPESHPSFVVWPHTQTWHDFSNGGGLGGDVFSYRQHRENLTFEEALFREAARLGIPNPFQHDATDVPELEREAERRSIEALFSKAAAYYHRALAPDVRRRWFHEHYGFVDEIIDSFLLGWADGKLQAHFKNELGIPRELALKTGLFVVAPGGAIKDFFLNRLIFPYWKDGRVTYFIARATEQTEDVPWEQAKYKKLLTHSEKHPYVSPTVENAFFYNEDDARGADELLVTEGVTDCIAAVQAGVPCISPVTTRFRGNDRDKLFELTRKAKRIVICNDTEESGAGAAGALETAAALYAKGRDVRIATLPRPAGVTKVDVNEFLKANPPDALRQLLQTAPRYVEYLIATVPQGTAKTELEPLLAPVMRALRHASAVELEGYIDTLVARLKVGRRSLQALLRATREEERGEGPAELPRTPVRRELTDAPVSTEHWVPRGWLLREAAGDEVAIHKVVESKDGDVSHVPVSSRPVVLTAWVKNLTTGNKMLEVAWKAGGKWRRATVEREKLFDTAKIVEALAGRGFPVSSSNRADMVAYLAGYESANIAAMPVRAVSEQMGWVGTDSAAFLCGDELITAENSQALVSFRAADEGEVQIARAFEPCGRLDAWTEGVAAMAAYPSVMLGLYASFAPPLLDLLKLPGFAVDWSYRTSAGKTVVLRLAASVWGNPDERAGTSLVHTWKTSLVGFERLASALKNIPIILDDTKTATYADLVADVLYVAAAGQGKTRGSVKGSRRTTRWRSILLSTGERKATDFTKDAGSAVRCLALWGPPFGECSDAIALRIRELERITRRNYGHAGRAFVRWLVRQDAASLRQRFDALHDGVWDALKRSFDSAVASRVADAITVIELAGELAHEALSLPWAFNSPCGAVLESITEGVRDVDRAREALQAAYDWAIARIDLFHGARERINPPDRWAGVWKHGEYVAFTGLTLREVLEGAGFEFDPIVKQWAERGWLLTDGGSKKRRTKTIKLGGLTASYYAVTQDALTLVGAEP